MNDSTHSMVPGWTGCLTQNGHRLLCPQIGIRYKKIKICHPPEVTPLLDGVSAATLPGTARPCSEDLQFLPKDSSAETLPQIDIHRLNGWSQNDYPSKSDPLRTIRIQKMETLRR